VTECTGLASLCESAHNCSGPFPEVDGLAKQATRCYVRPPVQTTYSAEYWSWNIAYTATQLHSCQDT
jgi:hypothetical protein